VRGLGDDLRRLRPRRPQAAVLRRRPHEPLRVRDVRRVYVDEQELRARHGHRPRRPGLEGQARGRLR
jgi:hypothetical protein